MKRGGETQSYKQFCLRLGNLEKESGDIFFTRDYGHVMFHFLRYVRFSFVKNYMYFKTVWNSFENVLKYHFKNTTLWVKFTICKSHVVYLAQCPADRVRFSSHFYWGIIDKIVRCLQCTSWWFDICISCERISSIWLMQLLHIYLFCLVHWWFCLLRTFMFFSQKISVIQYIVINCYQLCFTLDLQSLFIL